MEIDAVSANAAQRPLILASGSPYRRMLLERLGLPFTSVSPAVDERPGAAEMARELVRRLAEQKARAVSAAAPQALVIGSDQVAEIDGEIVGKPGSPQNAIAQLSKASGRVVLFHTGVAVLDRDRSAVEHVTTEVGFRTLSGAQIAAYVAAEPALDCAGSFKAEGLGISLFEYVRSDDPTALIGLPLIVLVRLLGEFGLAVPAPSP